MQRIVERAIDGRFVTGAAVSMAKGAQEWHLGAGDLTSDRAFFAASATKLCVTALMLRGQADGLWRLDDPAGAHLPGVDLRGLDLTGVRLRDLMAHTSGLADYFDAVVGDLRAGRDRAWGLPEVLDIARNKGPVARPGDLRRARYSDTNYQLLGRVIEVAQGAPFAAICRDHLFAPLGLAQTWIYDDAGDTRPAPLRFGPRVVDIPRAMASTQADGGMVTTTRDGLAFLRGFFGGAFFDPGDLAELMEWRPMFFPLDYGTGLMRFALPRILTGFRRQEPLIGHSGLNGTLLFAAPSSGFFIALTTNQAQRPGAGFRLAAKLRARV
ncbi:serine hydrolase [Paracoccus sp. (in: a-proteobacteria)]|uniref:serine hydrolase domain-containing protein n=1 Tax=Paracoccus sp. TaxID=267 RepID=UPI0026E02529|nr:serine hydrolase domain-containing protein [Paracoccus sp. (in: a-proteobacteria)]MDO5648084.1 serine hydrolase domain-containing protein [Paracoccus sp. (in: a-proteobacteria)]